MNMTEREKQREVWMYGQIDRYNRYERLKEKEMGV